jgi:hypothetical protein
MSVKDWVSVVPGKGAVQETARALLALADSPHDVRTVNAGNEFLVAPYLADRYTAPAAPKRRRAPKKEEGEE